MGPASGCLCVPDESAIWGGGSGCGSGVGVTFNLRNLEGAFGFSIAGADRDDRLGSSLDALGDVNGDDLPDFIVGAPGTRAGSGASQVGPGAAYAFFGLQNGFPDRISVDNLVGLEGIKIEGVLRGDDLGAGASAAGDINGDGIDDILVGAPLASLGAGSQTGSFAIVFGERGLGPENVPVAILNGGAGIRYDGLDVGGQLGTVVAPIGDVNGDGRADIAVTAPGTDAVATDPDTGNSILRPDSGLTYIIYGQEKASKLPVSLVEFKSKQVTEILGAQAGDGLGASLTGVGDVDGDGFDDFIVGLGQPRETGGRALIGYLVLGQKKTPKEPVDLALTGSDRAIPIFAALAGSSGAQFAGGGDVNGDGRPDILVGLPGADPVAADNGGQISVVFGGDGAFGSTIDLTALGVRDGVTYTGGTGDGLGTAVASAGDLNNDGFADIAVGSETLNQVTVIFGRENGPLSNRPLSTLTQGEALILTVADADGFGTVIAPGGDVNSDGIDDLLLGAPGSDVGTVQDAGETFVVLGAPTLGGVNDTPTAAPDTVSITTLAEPVDLLADQGAGRDTDPDLDSLTVVAINDTPITDSASVVLEDEELVVTLTNDGQLTAFLPITVPLGTRVETTLTYTIEDERGATALGDVTLDVRQATIPLAGLTVANGQSIRGEGPDDAFGQAITVIGDMNGDGVDDFAVGSVDTETVYVVFGGDDGGVPDLFDLSTLDGTNGFVFDGSGTSQSVATEIAAAGDFNNDGLADLAIAAEEAGDPGSVYLILGSDQPFGAAFTMADFDGEKGVRIDTRLTDDSEGLSIAGIGDFNDDGIDDIAIGTPLVNEVLFVNHGRVSVIFGREGALPAILSLDDQTEDEAVEIAGGGNLERLGSDVARVGDVNNDGIDDLLIGNAPNGLQSHEGYIIYGRDDHGENISLNNLNADIAVRFDEASGGDERVVAGIGDVNNDGIEDFAIGVPRASIETEADGIVFVVFGRDDEYGETLNLSGLEEGEGFFIGGAPGGALFGWDIAAAGDVNGDGIDDFIVGAVTEDRSGEDAGGAYVIFGRSNGFPLALDLATLNGLNGYEITGAAPGDFAGFSVAGGKDVNQDGLTDLIVGAPGSGANGVGSGAIHIVYGAPTLSVPPVAVDDTAETDAETIIAFDVVGNDIDPNVNGSLSIVSIETSGLAGQAVLLEDNRIAYNPQGAFDDLGFGEQAVERIPYTVVNNNGQTDVGEVVVTVTVSPVLPAILPPSPLNGAIINGTGANDNVNGSDNSDQIVLADGDDTSKGNQGNDFMYGGAGDDKLKGERGDDVLFGGTGNDELFATNGSNYVFGNDGNDFIKVGKGDDVVSGGRGDDEIRDKGGTDVFIFEPEWGKDLISKYEPGRDTLVFTDPEIDSLDDLQIVDAGKNSTGIVYQTNSILLPGVSLEEFDTSFIQFEYGPDILRGEIAGEGTSPVQVLFDPFIVLIEPQDPVNGETLPGTDGEDKIKGSNLDDFIQAGDGADQVKGGDGRDYIYGQGGRDRLDGGSGSDVIFGGADNDEIKDTKGSNYLFGGDGNDVIESGKGTDIIAGGRGDDIISDKGGFDTFLFEPDWGNDVITSFDPDTDRFVFSDPDLDSVGDLDFIVREAGIEVAYQGNTILLEGTVPEDIDFDLFFFGA